MKISLIVIGRMKRSPERELVDDYLARAKKLGGTLGIRDVNEIELDAGGIQTQEAEALIAKIPTGAHVILLDERGKEITSKDFSTELERRKDQGCPHIVFMIGGADGFTREMKSEYSTKISFGRMTWPHKLVRVLAAEQIYRALSLMAGTPYHRE